MLRFHSWLNRRLDSRGQALVEVALVLPLILMILLGIMEFGRAFNAYLTLQHAAREGARLGVTGAGDNAIIDRIKEVAVTLDPDRLVIAISPQEGARTRGDVLEVDLQYNFSFLVPLVMDIVGEQIQLQSSLKMRVE